MIGLDLLGLGSSLLTLVGALEVTLLVTGTAVHKLRMQVETLVDGVTRPLAMDTEAIIFMFLKPLLDCGWGPPRIDSILDFRVLLALHGTMAIFTAKLTNSIDFGGM